MKPVSWRTLLAGGLLLLLQAPSHGVDRSSSDSVFFSSAVADFNELDAPVQLVNDEFDPSLLDNPPSPTMPPPQVALPRTVLEKDQWRGSQCGISRPAQVVIRTAGTWGKLWAVGVKPYLAKPLDTPSVDFEKEIVVGIFLGEKPTPSFQIEIQTVKTESQGGDEVLIVRYQPIQKMQGVFNPPFAVRPYHLKKIPRFSGVVVFKKNGD